MFNFQILMNSLKSIHTNQTLHGTIEPIRQLKKTQLIGIASGVKLKKNFPAFNKLAIK